MAGSAMELRVGLMVAVDAECADGGEEEGDLGNSAAGDVQLDDAAGHESSVAASFLETRVIRFGMVLLRNRLLAGLAGGLAAVAVVVVIFSKILPVNPSTIGFFLLLVVLATATAGGFVASAVVSVAATLCCNYFFLPPIGQFTIADPANWVALFTFLLTSLVASHLSDRARQEADDAKRSQEATERLYALSRAILLTDAARPIGPQAAQSIAQIFDLPAVVILDGKSNATYRGGPADLEGIDERMREVVRLGARHQEQQLDIWPIALGGKPIGALAMKDMRASDGAVQSILNLVAIALERVRTEEAASKAEAARQSEEFKSTLLDAIAHEFKTPLTSIKAAATGLRVLNTQLPADQSELVSIIEEETDRLSQLVTEGAKMSEIDAGKVTLKRAMTSGNALIEATRSGFSNDRVCLAAQPGVDPSLWVDPDLIVLALRQLVDNALKYSGSDTPVTCRADSGGHQVLIRVIDQGPGIPERDRERVFEKFFRRPGVRNRVPGSGLGLHIAREIARIHGGDLWVEPAATGSGSEFCLALPMGVPK